MLNQVLAYRPATAPVPAARLLLLFAALALPTLALPWFVPVQPARSTSYMQGFSNPALWVLVVFALIAPAYGWFRLHPMPENSQSRALPGPEAQERLRSWAFASCLVFGAFLLVFSYNMAGYMDAEYFLIRMQLVEAGKLPYRDFEYAYGPLLLYAPVALHKLGLPASPSHALLVLVQTAAGYYAIHSILSWLFGPVPARWLFACVLLATAPGMLMGAGNYTYLRFAAPAALACFVLLRAQPRSLAASVLTGPLFILAWSISPEVAIATGFAHAAMATVRSGRMVASSTVSALSVACCVAVVPLVKDSYATLLAFGSGGNNFPAYPSVHIVFFLFCIFLATAQIATSPIRRATVDWYVFFYSVALIPGALGRCDPLHVVFYGWGFVVLAAKYCLRRWPDEAAFSRFSLAYMWIFLVSWIPLHTYYSMTSMGVVVSRTVIAASSALEPVLGKLPPDYSAMAQAFLQADSWGIRAVPGRPGDVFIIPPRSDMPNSAQFATYFVGLQNATSASAYDLLSKEIRGKRVLFRPETMPSICGPAMTEFASVLFMFPTGIFETRHDDKEVLSRFCRQLESAKPVAKRGRLVELEIP